MTQGHRRNYTTLTDAIIHHLYPQIVSSILDVIAINDIRVPLDIIG